MKILEKVEKNKNDKKDEKMMNEKCEDNLVLYVPNRTYSTFPTVRTVRFLL